MEEIGSITSKPLENKGKRENTMISNASRKAESSNLGQSQHKIIIIR